MTSKASGAGNAQDCEFYVGESSSMEGAEMTITGTARIDGRLSGKIYADHLIVGKTGYVAGEISGESAEVSGTLEQSVTLKKKLKVMSTGRVSGQIAYGSIDIDEGATIIGELQSDEGEGVRDRTDNLARLNAVSGALGNSNVSKLAQGHEDTGERETDFDALEQEFGRSHAGTDEEEDDDEGRGYAAAAGEAD